MWKLKDQRYKAIKSLIQSKGVQGLKDIFAIMPVSTVKQDMKINYNTLRRRIDNGELLTVKDIISMAELFEVDATDVFRLALADINKNIKSVRKKS